VYFDLGEVESYQRTKYERGEHVKIKAIEISNLLSLESIKVSTLKERCTLELRLTVLLRVIL